MTNSKEKDILLEELVQLINKLDPENKFIKKAYAQPVPLMAKEQMFDVIWSQPNRLMKVAQVLQRPLKERVDYYGRGRNILLPVEVAVGELPYADKDIPEFAAVVSSYFGGMPIVDTKVRRVYAPTFDIRRAYPVWYAELLIRRYPYFDRAKERVAISIAISEDIEIFKILDLASHVGPNEWIDASGVGMFTRSMLADAIGLLESNQLVAASVVIHPKRYADIRKWAGGTELDIVTFNVVTETGRVGTLLGMNLIVSTKCDPDAVYVVTTPDKLGRLFIRKDIEVKVMDHSLRGAYYVIGWENVGCLIHNSYGVVRIEFGNRQKGVSPLYQGNVPPSGVYNPSY